MAFQEEINRSVEVLQEGGLILYPTDTVWGIGCDATNETAVQKVYALKKRQDCKALICMVGNESMLERYVAHVPELAYDLIDLSDKPVTIVYSEPQGFAKNLIAEDGSIAIRVAGDKFCQYLIGKFRKPIVSTSANFAGSKTPTSFHEIDSGIIKGVDYVVNLQHNERLSQPSSIIKLASDGTIKVIRE